MMAKHGRLRYIEDPKWPKGAGHFRGPVVSCDVLSVGTVTEVYIAQRSEEQKVIVYSEDGIYLRSWTTDKLDSPHGLRVHVPPGDGLDSAEVWVTDIGQGPYGCSLKMFDRQGNLKITLGTPGKRGSGLDPLQFDQVSDLAFNPSGDMFVVDGDDGINHRLLKLSTDRRLVWSVGEEGSRPGHFYVPHSVDVDRFGQFCGYVLYMYHMYFGQVWVADRRNSRIQVFNGQTGSYIGKWDLEEHVYGLRFSTDKSLVLVLEELVGNLLMFASPDIPGYLGNYRMIGILHVPTPVIPHLFCVSQVTEAVFIAELGAERCQKFVLKKRKAARWLWLGIVCCCFQNRSVSQVGPRTRLAWD
ncbi:NHL repeat-containing protein 3-like [Branchiostoma floridae x Branchiostoma belcheri]